MGIYTRFKRDPEGLRHLVELMESTPKSKRDKMIQAGMREDPDYTELALKYLLGFEDILKLPDIELAELLAAAPPRSIGYAIKRLPEETIHRFLRNSPPRVSADIRGYLLEEVNLASIGGSQLKLIEVARGLEKKGLIHTKTIPKISPDEELY